MPINNNILNQKGTPAFYSDIFANRPTYGYAGRVFISTDTGAIYEDTGTSWTLIADAGAGTTGTLQQVTTNGNTTTLGIVVQGININKGAGTGLYNNGFGTNVLISNTTGTGNLAVGYNALNGNTTGTSNVGVGNNALNNNTTASFNTAIGNSALAGNNGASNTAIGYNALANNSTGSTNTAVGTSALQLNTTAGQNTAIGNSALATNTTGDLNTSVGQGSMQLNTTGNNNTALGTSSLNANTTGASNTAIGYLSLNGNTTGTGNISIGSSSGSSITTGSNNTIIGSYAGTSTLSSNIILADGNGNVRLFSNSAGLIGINQAVGTPSAQLDIHTTQTYGLAVNGTGTSNAYLGFANAGTYKWRIGNTYNAGANSFDIYNVGTSSNALSINSTSNVVTLNSYPLIDGGSVLIKLGSNTNANGYTGIGAVATGLTINLGAAGTTGSLLFNTSASYSYTFPAATGTLALTSNLSSYLPLAGGTLTGALSGTSITGTSLIKSGGTSAQILAADGSVITAGTNITISGGTISSSGGGGSITLSAIGSSPNANAATLTGSVLNLEPASVSFGGVVTTGVQNFTGVKSFASNTLIGTTTDGGQKLQVNGTFKFISLGGTTRSFVGDSYANGMALANVTGTTGSWDHFYFQNPNGNVGVITTNGTVTTYNSVSDYRLKTDLKEYSGLNLISKIKTYDFEWIVDKTRMHGVLAHELQNIIPYAVNGQKDAKKWQSVDYSKIVPILIKAVQELNEKIERL